MLNVQFMRSIIIGSLVFTYSAVTFSSDGTAEEVEKTPNILLVIADDMGIDASACYDLGDEQANMPILEKLCDSGMVFENAYSAPVCSPTRATIMTGKYGFRTGVGSAIPPEGGIGVSSDEITLFDRLKETDYAANVIGKWHIAGSDDGLNHPQTLGVDEYYGLYSGGTRDYFNWTAVSQGKQIEVNTYTTTDFTDKAIEWIDKQDQPWFLWLAYNAPHTPFHLPPSHLHTANNLSDDPASINENPVPYYNAMLEALDTELGRLLSSIPQQQRDNTLIIFIGDNGTPSKTQKSLFGQRRMKGTLYEGGTHVPMIVNGPGVMSGRSESLVNTTDIYATILDIVGPASNAQDSFSFFEALSGDNSKREYIYTEHFAANPDDMRRGNTAGWAIRDARYKLLAIDGEPHVLFDLIADPLETNDLLSGTLSNDIKAIASRLEQAKASLE